MRIEGTHQFNAPIERVYAALLNPDMLRAALPGCERMTQLGPPDATGQLHGEARVMLAADAARSTFVWSIEPGRIPRHVKFTVHATDHASPAAFAGFIDLVAREGQTVAAYVCEVNNPVPTMGADPAPGSDAGTAYCKAAGDALAALLEAAESPRATLQEALPILRADSARGRITVLPAEPTAAPVATRLRPMLNRSIWVVAGIATGIVVLAGLAATLSLLRRRDASGVR